MANSETIKTTIDANINTNGNQAITGAVMNSVLKQMIDSTDTELAKLSEEVFTPSTNLFNPATALKDTGISSTNGNTATLTGYVASDFIPVKPATDYTFKGRYIVAWYDKNKVFIVGEASDTKTIKSPDNAAYTRFSFRESGYNVNLMMVNEGSELLPFEEYKLQFNPKYLEDVELLKEKVEDIDANLRNLDSEIIEKVSGTNLFNPNEVSFDTTISSTTGELVSYGNLATSGYIPIKPNTTYTFKTRNVVVWFDKDKNYVSASGSDETNLLTLTSPSNASFVRFSYNYNGFATEKMQMNEGDALLPFVPYQEPKKLVREELLGYAYAYADEAVKSLSNELLVNINIFNVDTASWDTSIASKDGKLVTLNGFATSDFIAIKPSTPYTLTARWVVVWFDNNKQYISASGSDESSVLTLTSPSNAAYVRFSYKYAEVTNMQMNEGDVLLPYEDYGLQFNPKFIKKEIKGEISYALGVTNLKLQHSVFENPSNLCLIAAKNIWSKDKTPDYNSFLFLDISTQKLYASSNTPNNPQFLCDWNAQLADGEDCQYWMATITKDGDIIFLRDHQRRNPIIYPHDNYANPYVVDFGDDIAPYGWLMSGGVVQFDDGTFVFGDYAYHSEVDEANNDPRVIWRVSAPYNDPNNWQKAHSFKHVYYQSEISNEPNNEIGHIHAVQYDWYNDVTYCTTGDIDRHCRLWKSMDKGRTWSAVEGAVGWKQGDEGTGNTQTIGQKWRFTNMIFTKDCVYWCTDSFRAYHCLYKIQRGADGVVKAETLEKVINLEMDIDSSMSQATYVAILLRKPYGILIIDRAEPRTDDHLDIKFYDLTNQTLHIVKTFDRASTNASSLEHETRIGLPNQFATLYQPESCEYVLLGGGTIIRPNNTEIFNNSRENYVGGLKLNL